jgi:hypothetical protein
MARRKLGVRLRSPDGVGPGELAAAQSGGREPQADAETTLPRAARPLSRASRPLRSPPAQAPIFIFAGVPDAQRLQKLRARCPGACHTTARRGRSSRYDWKRFLSRSEASVMKVHPCR